MANYRFLLDRDVSKTASLFPKHRRLALADVGLAETASDRKIVEEACYRKCIIVTANGDDFLREIERFLKQTKMKDCHDLGGSDLT